MRVVTFAINPPNPNRGVRNTFQYVRNEVTMGSAGILDKIEFCANSSNTPLTVEDWYALGYHTVAIEGFWNPDDGDLNALLDICFRRYFMRIKANVNLNCDDEGYFRFSARLTEKPNLQ